MSSKWIFVGVSLLGAAAWMAVRRWGQNHQLGSVSDQWIGEHLSRNTFDPQSSSL